MSGERVNVTPKVAKPGELLSIDGWCLDPRSKYEVVTVDASGYVAGMGSNGTRPNPDGAFSRGILAPPKVGNAKVQIRRGRTVAAEVSLTVKS